MDFNGFRHKRSIADCCEICVSFRPEPAKVTLNKWPEANKVFERIHIDYTGPINNHMHLIITDAFSKWPEIFLVDKADTLKTLEKLKEVFFGFGLSAIVSDNGTPFTSSEFSKFCELNSIKHLTITPGHPSSNGAAENTVK